MRVLVTNDDGIGAPGLSVLVHALAAEGHDIEVAAPFADRSGSGSALGSIDNGAEIPYEELSFPGLPSVRAIKVDAPPAFAVLAAGTGVFGERPDVVVAGINDGFNTGRLILNSSTVGAVLTGAGVGARGLAISAGFPPDHRFDTAAQVGVAAVNWLIRHSAPRTVLNVNVPNLDLDELRGVRLAKLAARGLMGLRVEREDRVLRLHRFDNTARLGTDTDSSLVLDGFVALSVLSPVTASVDASDDPAQRVQDAMWPMKGSAVSR